MQTELTFAAWLKRKRKEQGLTQETLAGLAGCSTVYLKKIEAGQRQPTRPVIEALLEALQAPKEAQPTLIALAFATPAAKSPPTTNLPVPLTPFIGREKEAAAVCRLLLRDGARLVTLTGPGGTGKTRLALAVARRLAEDGSPPQHSALSTQHFPDGVFFIDLAPLSDPALVIPTIAQTLDVREQGGQPILDRLKDTLRDKRLLLVLDNFEQVAAAAPQVGEVLVHAPQVKALVTSRVLLHLRGEHDVPVPPLGLPPRTDDRPTTDYRLPTTDYATRITQYEAVRLFIERAVAVKPDFAVTNANAPAVAEICHRLDGLPLAIELAAARVRLLPPQAMLARLDQRLKFLTGGARDLPARQQTLRAAIDWSYTLLDEGEKTLFRRLAVFVGGFTLEAAEAIGNAGRDLPLDVLEGVASLVNKSLVRQMRSGEDDEGEPRFTLLETIREYALERLAESGEEEGVRQAHARVYLALAEQAEPALHGPEEAAWLRRLEPELENFRAALDWAARRAQWDLELRLAASLQLFWYSHWRVSEGRRWLDVGLEQTPGHVSEPIRARALTAAVWLNHGQPDNRAARAMSDESLALYRTLGDTAGLAYALATRGHVAVADNEVAVARSVLEEAMARARDVDNLWALHSAERDLGILAYRRGGLDEARVFFEASLESGRRLGWRRTIAFCLTYLGWLALEVGDYGRSQSWFQESMTLRAQSGQKIALSPGLEGCAILAAAMGQPARAARLMGAAQALREAMRDPLPLNEAAFIERWLLQARASLDAPVFETELAEGRAMTMEQAVAYALEGTSDSG